MFTTKIRDAGHIFYFLLPPNQGRYYLSCPCPNISYTMTGFAGPQGIMYSAGMKCKKCKYKEEAASGPRGVHSSTILYLLKIKMN